MDTIFVKDLMVTGKHGVMKHEWSHEQQFLIDITAWFDTTKSAQSDNLDDSADYAKFCSIARKIIEGETVYLIEKLASQIAKEILLDTRIEKVEISVRKPSVLPSGVPGVTIMREQGV